MASDSTRAGGGERSDARSLAFETLRRVEERGAYADVELGRRLARARLSPADQALATRIVYGTLAWQGRIDWHLQRLCHRPVETLDPWLRVVLRLGVFQILFLDRVPDHAAVDTSVELARPFKGGAATGLVNATLRRASTELSDAPLPDVAADPVGARAVRWSHPSWLVTLWRDQLGLEELDRLLQADQEPAPTVLRVNTLRAQPEVLLERLHRAGHADAARVAFSPVGLRIRGRLAAIEGALPPGAATLQSEASQLISYVVSPEPDQRVLDACGAPGGKATHLAELMQNRGEVVVVDIDAKGLDSVRQRARDLGTSIVHAHRGDARQLADRGSSLGSPFDRILVDAPCSGLGTLRSHPELRWRRRLDSIAALSRLQLEILGAAARVCAPGGFIVYSTCTLSRQENEDVVERFCREHPSFRIESPVPDLPATIRPLVDRDGFLRTFPHRHDLDGFFAARLRRFS